MGYPVRLISRLLGGRLQSLAGVGGAGRSYAILSSRFASASATAVAWALALAFAAWVVSGWFWDRAAPAAEYFQTVVETDPVAVAQAVAAKHLMGVPKVQTEDKSAGGRGSFRLLGLMTASDRWPGFAILSQHDKESLVVMEGEEVLPGVTLLKVMSDQVIIERNGTKESLPLNLP